MNVTYVLSYARVNYAVRDVSENKIPIKWRKLEREIAHEGGEGGDGEERGKGEVGEGKLTPRPTSPN